MNDLRKRREEAKKKYTHDHLTSQGLSGANHVGCLCFVISWYLSLFIFSIALYKSIYLTLWTNGLTMHTVHTVEIVIEIKMYSSPCFYSIVLFVSVTHR